MNGDLLGVFQSNFIEIEESHCFVFFFCMYDPYLHIGETLGNEGT